MAKIWTQLKCPSDLASVHGGMNLEDESVDGEKKTASSSVLVVDSKSLAYTQSKKKKKE